MAAAPILVHAKRLFTPRAGAGSCTSRASSRRRTSAARRGSRSHRSGCSRITDCGGSYASPNDGNLGEPGSRPHRRFCQPEHSSARIHKPSLVRQRAGTFKCFAQRPHPLLHILARRLLARPVQCHASPEPRLRHQDSYRFAPGTHPHHAIARAVAVLPRIPSLQVRRAGRRGPRCCHTSSALRAFYSAP
jgi:hypothetical protein